MPTRGDRTKAEIVATAAHLFNERGFAGTSMSHVLAATGLEKGGIYRHFQSKDELALASFDYALHVLEERRGQALKDQYTAFERLTACIDVVAESVKSPPLRGGCPILNTAIDADDTHAALRKRAQHAVKRWQGLIEDILEDGKASGEIDHRADASAIATVITSALEGAIMITSLLRCFAQMDRVAKHLHQLVASYRTPVAITR